MHYTAAAASLHVRFEQSQVVFKNQLVHYTAAASANLHVRFEQPRVVFKNQLVHYRAVRLHMRLNNGKHNHGSFFKNQLAHYAAAPLHVRFEQPWVVRF